MIKTGGINVAPLEVEGILATHSKIKQAYVVGIADPIKEEKIVAVVVFEEGGQAKEQELLTFCREDLASYKVPDCIFVYEEGSLPLTSTGKINKPKLKEQLVAKCS